MAVEAPDQDRMVPTYTPNINKVFENIHISKHTYVVMNVLVDGFLLHTLFLSAVFPSSPHHHFYSSSIAHCILPVVGWCVLFCAGDICSCLIQVRTVAILAIASVHGGR